MSVQALGSIPATMHMAESAPSAGSWVGRAVEWIKDTASSIVSFVGKIIKSVASGIVSIARSIKDFVVEHPTESLLFAGLAAVTALIARAFISSKKSDEPTQKGTQQSADTAAQAQGTAPQAPEQMYLVQTPVIDPFTGRMTMHQQLVPGSALQQQSPAAMRAQQPQAAMHPQHMAAMMAQQPQAPMHPQHMAAMQHAAPMGASGPQVMMSREEWRHHFPHMPYGHFAS